MREVPRAAGTVIATTGEVLSPAILARRAADYERVSRYIEPALSANTRRSYDAHLRAFSEFCADRAWSPLPASEGSVIAYLTYAVEQGMKPSSARVAKSVISVTHDRAGHPNPTKGQATKDALANLARRFGTAPARAQAMTADHVMTTIRGLGTEPADLRDRAILLLGYSCAFRRSEIVALDVADFQALPNGDAHVHVRRSKTDQEGKGATATAPRVAYDAVRAWWAAAGIVEGPAFVRFTRHGVGKTRLSAQTVRVIVKRRAGHAGLDPRGLVKWSGHSLRRGAATEAVAHGADTHNLMTLGRWTSAQGAQPYVDARPIQDPAKLLGLDGL